jgi:hypothetical protein
MYRLPSFNLSVSASIVSMLLPVLNLGLVDMFGTDPVPMPRRGSGGSPRTQRHTGAGGAGMHRAWKKRRASGRA